MNIKQFFKAGREVASFFTFTETYEDREYCFTVAARDEQQARQILKGRLLKMLDSLDGKV